MRPRYGRVAAAGASVLVTAVALLGGLGIIPQSAEQASGSDAAALSAPIADNRGDDAADASSSPVRTSRESRLDRRLSDEAKEVAPAPVLRASGKVAPENSGEGRRIVFSEESQRVWLLDEDDEVERSYLVSGSVYDNLEPGTYAVYSRSEQAYGIDDSGTMKWFVRFTRGDNAAIGFHDIPIDDGELVQTKKELGTPLSHGCIRQEESDARALWEFAPIGTTVVVI